MAKQAATTKRPRRERGSLNPDDIIDGAFELAEQVSIDGLSMPLLGKHLDVGVTSIYWYFRKKDDLLNAMTDRALRQYVLALPKVESRDWREALADQARSMRAVFLANPILCDLILIRSSLSAHAAHIGAQQLEQSVATLVEAGLPLDDAFDTYSALSLHVSGSVVLQRLYDKNKEQDSTGAAYYDDLPITPDSTPLLAEAMAKGRKTGAPDEHNFEYGLKCILDNASALIESAKKKPATTPAKRPSRSAASKTTASKSTARKSSASR
ncbi:TetR family transcriptional regulator [Nocardia cyriacigeorgica]|uniref:TetR family transcriptional regulator n=1 Tax=Nocardia cyriacigeorgica TaxID=135487 RepID=A0A5R8P741_9NOCA|nr:TetR/AcrR family transcriptional regulator C-terminal domain-containing protein [Nocardia cyriacigeorgica]TLF98266.1 TetR family transcriptional regulator [Nocardia cyriacigeorgica]